MKVNLVFVPAGDYSITASAYGYIFLPGNSFRIRMAGMSISTVAEK